MPWLSSAEIKVGLHHNYIFIKPDIWTGPSKEVVPDTVPNKTNKQKQEAEDKKKIKEVAKAKRLPKPEKIDETNGANTDPKVKPKRQRRPPGLERPPEIPRRNGN
ncbi:MAG: hypothetical protein ABI113_09235 [Mucilaginibacter sp.]